MAQTESIRQTLLLYTVIVSNSQIITQGETECNFDCYEYNYSLITLNTCDGQLII